MKRVLLLVLVILGGSAASAAGVLVEAEGFSQHGGWLLDPQFLDVMGSPYLLAHGLGKPVANAATEIDLPQAGAYRLWVRTMDWVPAHHPGTFRVVVDGVEVAATFGDHGQGWTWQDGGKVEIRNRKARIELRDLTGFDGHDNVGGLTHFWEYGQWLDPIQDAEQTGVATGIAAFLCKKHNTTPRGVYQQHLAELQDLVFERQVVVRPRPREVHLRNPGMGFIFYSVAGRESLPEQADVVFACVPVWGQVEQAKGQYDWDIPQIKGVADLAARHQRRWAIRIMPSFQGHKQPIPAWLVEAGVKLFSPDPKWLAQFGQQDLYEPEWWNPLYSDAHAEFVRAYGQRFDGAPGLEFIDMRYFGFWGEGHRFGATQPWPSGVDKRELMKRFIDMYAAAFRKTPLVVQTARDQDEPYPEATAIDYALEKGCWMRRDGFGGYIDGKETRLIQAHWQQHPLVAENGAAYADYLAGKVAGWSMDRVVEEMLAHHVSYFPMGWGLRDWEALVQQRPDLVNKASLRMGYRLEVTKASWPRVVKPGQSFTVETVWRNTAVASLPFRWHPAVYLLAPDRGQPIARAVHAEADPRTWTDGKEATLQFTLSVPAEAKPARHALAVAIEDDRGQPAIALGIEGDDGQKRFLVGHADVSGK